MDIREDPARPFPLPRDPRPDRIRVHANGWTCGAKTAREMADRAADVAGLGSNTIKAYPFQNDESETAIAENVRAVDSLARRLMK